MVKYRDSFQDWQELTKRERKGVWSICGIILLLIAYNYFAPFIFRHEMHDITARKAAIEKWLSENKPDTIEENIDFAKLHTQLPADEIKRPFLFNPNTIGVEQWQALGFTEKQAQAIIRHRETHKFKVKTDLSKVFVVSDDMFERLYAYIDLPESTTEQSNAEKHTANHEQSTENTYNYDPDNNPYLKVEINTADTNDFKKLKGIGGYFAKMIVLYREKLGGYHSTEQLLEVKKMTAERLDGIREYLLIDTSLIRKININTAGVATLNSHPYIDYNQAKTIVAYREQHGLFKTVEGIKKCVLIDEETFEKIKYYLCLE